MERTPLVSVILPVYNGEAWLERSLSSVASQTYENWECILVNDGSTDGSAAVCGRYVSRDPRFKLIQKANGGVSSARNAALAQLQGEYFTFCDQDDAMDPHSLEYAVRMQLENPGKLVMWGYTRDAEGFAKAQKEPLEYQVTDGAAMQRQHPCGSIFVTIWNKLFVTEKVRAAGLCFDETLGKRDNLGEDKLFMEQYLQAAFPGGEIPMAYAATPRYFHYPDNKGSITRTAVMKQEFSLPQPEAGYCDFILQEYRAVRKEMAPRLIDIPPLESIAFVRHYTRCFAFGVWCARQLGEPLPPGFLNGPEIQELLEWWKTNRIFNPYYIPWRLKCSWLVAHLYAWDETKNAWFFRLSMLFHAFLGKDWKKNAGE